MGKLYWFLNVNGEENLSGAVKVYKKILDERENVVLLSAKEIRQAHRDVFDEENSDEAWKQSENRDMMMIRYLIDQDIDVVYCTPCEFEEIKNWAEDKISEVEFIAGIEDDLQSGALVMPARETGTMYWVTGLSGAGKTTVGTLLYKKMRECKKNVVLLDGDMFRDAMRMEPDYSREGRAALCYRNLRLEKILLEGGLDFVSCTIAMIENVRQWNRENLKKYVEIYLEVPLRILEERDSKGLYAGVRKGLIENVVGVDQVAEYPQNPEIKIVNDGTKTPYEVVDEIWNKLGNI